MLNDCTIQGRLTADPQLHAAPDGTKVCTVILACGRDYKDKSGTRPTDFISVVCWAQRADFIAEHFRKGQLIIVRGRMKTRSYKDKSDITRYVTEIAAEQLYFSDSKKTAAVPDAPPFADAVPVADDYDIPPEYEATVQY